MFLKLETNPMMDIKGITILVENPHACSWKSFHESHYNYLLHTTSFHEQLVFLSHIHSPLPKKKHKIKLLFPPTSHDPS
jgi:hypothetical protein